MFVSVDRIAKVTTSIWFLFSFPGPRAENSELNWKRRLKIALDAAQGNYFSIIYMLMYK
jgi:hypothetical protein